jgi:BMFP domain-containing protein YqiC
MSDQKLFDELGAKIREMIAASPARDLEKNMRALLSSTFARLDLVTREEFDVQREVLARTREKLDKLEASLAAIEKNLK